MLVDSHCHLNFPDFKEDLDQVIARAKLAGVGGMLTINTKLNEAKELQEISDRFKNVFCTVGIHPSEAKDHTDDIQEIEAQIKQLCSHQKVVGLGETGLDYYYGGESREIQIESFKTHLRLSQELDLPVIIHTRDADDDTISCIEEVQKEKPHLKIRGVFHCFTGSQNLADKALKLGFYISMSGILTFKNAQSLQEVARSIPLNRLLVETDAPFLAPQPHRGKRNEPAFTRHTAEFLAQIKDISLETVIQQTTENFFSLFNKVPRSSFYL